MMEPTSLIAFGSALGLSPAAGKLLERAFGPAADEAGAIIREKINSRRNRVIEKATRDLEKAKIEPREVPLRLLAPILRHATLEDDETLSDRWAALLANAAAGPKGAFVSPFFAHLLSVITPWEAKMLQLMSDPDELISLINQMQPGPAEGVSPSDNSQLRDQLYLCSTLLITHGFLQEAGPQRRPDGLTVWEIGGPKRYELSPLAKAFLAAVTPPQPANDSSLEKKS
jgi:hypothetical protein